MTDNLKYWQNGEPIIFDTGLGGLKYWKDGEPFVYYEPESAPVADYNVLFFGHNF